MEQNNRILITGATGFLGVHIAEMLIANGYEVFATKRTTSNLDNCISFVDKIEWIDIENINWEKVLAEISPEIIIHSMWIGVDAMNRDDWKQQIQNITLTENLLSAAAKASVKKIIGLGSQAEYGNFSKKISENAKLIPTSAYGVIKNTCADMTRVYCESNEIKWYWLRLFPLFGEKESSKWLIPSVIRSIQTQKSMDFTAGEQRYAYLYVKDFAQTILTLIKSSGASGVYNISSSNPQPLKNIITEIRDILNPSFQLNFGALPYRNGQSMHIEGDVSKFEKMIGAVYTSDFQENLKRTIDYYIQ